MAVVLTAIMLIIVLLAAVMDRGEKIEKAGTSGHAAEAVPHRETVLVIGTDYREDSEAGYNTEACDFAAILFFNDDEKTVNAVVLNRDSMMDVPYLAVNGQVAGWHREQLALAHGYGSGGSDSSRNVVRAVSRLCSELPIDYWVKFRMDDIPALNDFVGGVDVHIYEDMTQADETLIEGTDVHLTGIHAENYVRARKSVGSGMNTGRMQRHLEYVQGYVEAAEAAYSGDSSLPIRAAGELSEHFTSDMSAGVLSEFASKLAEYRIDEIVTPEGGETVNDATGYAEFEIDMNNLQEILNRVGR